MTWFYFALIAAGAWTLTALAEKKACSGEKAIQVAVASSFVWIFLALLLIPFVKLPTNAYIIFLMIIAGAIFGGSFYLSSKAFKYLSASEASPLYNIGTVITVILAILFLGEKVTTVQLLGVITIITGTYVLELKKGSFLAPLTKLFKSEKVHYVIISAFGYSVLAILSKYILGFVDPVTYLFSQLVISGAFMLALSYLRHNGFKDVITGLKVHRWSILIISSTMMTAQLFEIFALKTGEAALVMPVTRLWTLFAVVLGGAFYKEGHKRNRIIAAAIMLAGVFIIYL